jgi:NAD(P)-dependent dehydrogenase (short-subunit alcohol dehydrogenase family)
MDFLITGSSKGIGEFLLEKYSVLDNNVYGTYNNTNTGRKNLYKVDISSYDDVSYWINSLKLANKIILINCAGISYNSFAHKADLEKWIKVIEVNLVGTFNVIHKLLPIMRRNNFGRIINFSSVTAQLGTPGASGYAASKSALWGLSKSIAVENAIKGITINNINLGYSDIGMGINNVPEEFHKEMQKKIPNKMFCPPEQIYNTINYIIENDYLNGTCIDLNGGLF